MTSAEQAEVVVIGGGHNGLTCAAYLAMAGRDVLVLEARDEAGGCASTVDAIGARVNICNCDHTMVLASGIIEELGLAAHGLRYLDIDPVQIAVSWSDAPVFVQWRSVERTLDGLARSGGGGRAGNTGAANASAAYRRYLKEALPAAQLMLAVQGSPASTGRMVTAAARRGLRGSATLLRWARVSLLDVLSGFGFPPWLTAAAATSGPAVWGLPPDAPGTGLAALGFATRHLVGVGRPAGGSGALPAALARCVAAHGGQIVTGARAAGVAVSDGRVRAVRLADGRTVKADIVINATDPRALLVDWLDGVPAAARLRANWAARADRDGYESKVDAVVTALPLPRAVADLDTGLLPAAARNVPTTVISPLPDEQIAAAAKARDGLVSDTPMFLLNTPSVRDSLMRPGPGRDLLSLEVLWTPYALGGGWAASAEPWSWLERLAALCEPGLLDCVQTWRAMTPPDYEREFGLVRGYAPSFPGGVVAALTGRQPELSRYRTPVRGLYLTGAATFPGAGVWGASGRNAAAVVLATARRQGRNKQGRNKQGRN
ncbi:MAG TPA: NAD(P)/FAD-dependent oxidoreductase [Trebonia sp.]|nr:NAD(P)/FAD-dependent oxidoreductase [Trebonia sp.]